MEKISFVIPIYNAQHTIKELVNRIDNTLLQREDNYEHEILLVNDGSEDNSLNVCKEIAKNNAHVKILNLSRNFGQRNAIMAGFRYATGGLVVCLDDDLQTPPEEVWKLIDTLANNDYDIVYGYYQSKKHSLLRNIGSKINLLMARKFVGLPKEINMSSYFVVKDFIVKEVIKYNNPFPYMAGFMFRVTQKIGNIQIKHEDRKYGTSNYSFSKLVSLWLSGFTSYSVKPLRSASLLGFCFAVLSFLGIVVLVIRKVIVPETQVGWTSLIIAVAFFGGIQLVSIGLLGEYVGRIFLSINKLPQYVVREKINLDNEQLGEIED